jgi:hypothetical protein
VQFSAKLEESAEIHAGFKNQGGVRHMQVVYVDPGKTLRMIGGLGPLQSMAATGSMTVRAPET